MPAQRDYPDQARILGLLWRGEDELPGRSGLTLGRIVGVGADLADELGLAALSMRKVADRLGVGAMSLYTYVPGKEELTHLMVEHVHGELVTDGSPSGETWRDQLLAMAHEHWEHYQRHPWLLDVPVSRPTLGPNVMDRYEYELRIVEGIGLDDHQMNGVIEVIQGHVAGTAATMLGAASDARRSGMSDDEWWHLVLPTLEQVLAGRNYPLTARVGQAIGAPHTEPHYVLDFGLALILDGVESLIAEVQE